MRQKNRDMIFKPLFSILGKMKGKSSRIKSTQCENLWNKCSFPLKYALDISCSLSLSLFLIGFRSSPFRRFQFHSRSRFTFSLLLLPTLLSSALFRLIIRSYSLNFPFAGSAPRIADCIVIVWRLFVVFTSTNIESLFHFADLISCSRGTWLGWYTCWSNTGDFVHIFHNEWTHGERNKERK